jgi:hypothetical protein
MDSQSGEGHVLSIVVHGIQLQNVFYSMTQGKAMVSTVRLLQKEIGFYKIYISGKIQIWINGTTVLHVEGLQMRNSSASVFKGIHFQTFFGGAFYLYLRCFDRASLSCE